MQVRVAVAQVPVCWSVRRNVGTRRRPDLADTRDS